MIAVIEDAPWRAIQLGMLFVSGPLCDFTVVVSSYS
jgi:hypothetical protein